ncbi:DNA repair protein RecO [Mariniphaga sediminis]|jgi:DNA repair protein RecO (recombination protein O)|uniref:DNA repair protein RecO n=1 Tax=Mariniphaga sediminis TaxID=1628158 RepID=A0A399D301_9BACT|nr:DNA repair protein RecO [Mariniphaga sediminis]RIH65598.1 DNA repair protein RecO [Mariniphaga sediminis]
MLATTEGIILHLVKYGENSVIVNIYTKEFGRQAYMLNISSGKRSKNKAGFLQPLFLVDLVCYQKESRDVQRIKEIKNTPAYQNIPFDIAKSSQVIFLAEMLSKTLREQESAPPLFDFIKNSLLYLDLMEDHTASFHLWFLFRLTEYLGFLPDTQKTGFEGWLDMRKGEVVPFEPSHPFFFHKEATEALGTLASLKIREIRTLKISRNLRSYLTSKLVEYYQLHFEHLGEIKSLKVLHEIFA